MYSVYPEAPYAHELDQWEYDSAKAMRAYRQRRAIRLGLVFAGIIGLSSLLIVLHRRRAWGDAAENRHAA